MVLQCIEIVIPTLLGKQLLMGSLLHDLAVGQQNNIIRMLNGTQTVGNDQHGADVLHLLQRVLDQHFRFRIDIGSGLVQDSLEKMKNIGTMLVVAHRLSTIQHSDNIILLSKGKILEQGTHQELLHQKGRYYQLYTLQYNKQLLSGK